MALSTVSAPFQQVAMPALDLRRAGSAGGSEGVVNAGDMAVVQRAAGANMSVDIGLGEAFVQGDNVAAQGMYYAFNDVTFNLAGFTAAHATLPRVDRVALRVRDAFHGDAANDLAFVIVTGTATTGATLANLTGAAAVPANHLLLANVLIPATATSVTTANIDTTVRARARRVIDAPGVYTEIVANVSFTATSPGTANVIITSPQILFNGRDAYWVEFYAAGLEPPRGGAGISSLVLYEGASVRGNIATTIEPAAAEMSHSVFSRRLLTPAAGTYTISIRGYVNAGTGVVLAGDGLTSNAMPAYLRVIPG